MEYSDNLTVFERVLLYNKIQEIKHQERQAEEESIKELNAKSKSNK